MFSALRKVALAAFILSPVFIFAAAPTAVITKNGGSGGISGSGTLNKLAKWASSSSLGDSLLSDDGTNITLSSGQLLAQPGTYGYSFVGLPTYGLYGSATNFNLNGPTQVRLQVAGVDRVVVSSTIAMSLPVVPAATGTTAVGSTSLRWSAGYFGGNTVTASTPAFDIAQTQNSAGVSFIGASMVFTETATAAGSRYFQILGGAAGTTDEFYINKGGTVVATGDIYGANILAGSSSYLYLGSRSRIGSGSDGLLVLQNNAGTDFSRLQLGGTTSSFPALKRSGTELHVRLADDSNYAPINTGTATVQNLISTGDIITTTQSPASGAACTAGTITWDASYIYVCTASGAWKRAALTGGY